MKNSDYKFLMEKIDFIKKTENPYGILLVGSSRNVLEKPDDCKSDIDIFVIKDEDCFEREVFSLNEVEYDISYISKRQIEKAIKEEIHSLITVLSHATPLFESEVSKSLTSKTKKLYEKGPSVKSSFYIDYKRFVITKAFESLEKKSDTQEFEFILHNCLKEALIFYFETRAKWIPSDKKLISSISDVQLNNYVKELLDNKEQRDKLNLFDKILYYLLEPFGGKLYEWKKSAYPFDFN